jgi:hypothetical protein
MTISHRYPWRWLLATLLLGAACSEDTPKLGWDWKPPVCQDGTSCCTEEEIVCAGDPDRGMLCTCHHSWSCDDDWYPSRCSQNAPDTPDGSHDWSCSVDQEFERCERDGESAPQGKNGWSCKVEGDQVVCRRPANTPDGTKSWKCSYQNGAKVCEKIGGGGAPPPVPKVTTGSGCSKDAPPDVLILLDHSGSMGALVDGQSKWSHATSSVNKLVTAYPGELRFGLMLLPGPGGSCNGGVVDVAIGDDTATAISAVLSMTPTGGGTPIAASLINASSALSAKSGFVLLVTDGGESCGGDPVSEVKLLNNGGIKTYVVGFGGAVDSTQLGAMAVAGGTAQYYQAPDVTKLGSALDTIVKQGICK